MQYTNKQTFVPTNTSPNHNSSNINFDIANLITLKCVTCLYKLHTAPPQKKIYASSNHLNLNYNLWCSNHNHSTNVCLFVYCIFPPH
jgi:hypothetical protein